MNRITINYRDSAAIDKSDLSYLSLSLHLGKLIHMVIPDKDMRLKRLLFSPMHDRSLSVLDRSAVRPLEEYE